MKFHPLLANLWLRTEKIIEFWQTKSNNSSSTDDKLIKLYMHHHPMVIYDQYKLNKIPFIAYKVMAEDEIMHCHCNNSY